MTLLDVRPEPQMQRSPDEPGGGRRRGEGDRVRHIFAVPADAMREIETALCGERIKVRRVHGPGVHLATCRDCGVEYDGRDGRGKPGGGPDTSTHPY